MLLEGSGNGLNAGRNSIANRKCKIASRAVCHDILDFSRENSPLEVYGSGIRCFLMIRPRVSVDGADFLRESGRDPNVAVSLFTVI